MPGAHQAGGCLLSLSLLVLQVCSSASMGETVTAFSACAFCACITSCYLHTVSALNLSSSTTPLLTQLKSAAWLSLGESDRVWRVFFWALGKQGKPGTSLLVGWPCFCSECKRKSCAISIVLLMSGYLVISVIIDPRLAPVRGLEIHFRDCVYWELLSPGLKH